MSGRIKVEHPDPPVTKTVLAQSIVDIGKACKGLRESGLNETAIVVLLHDKTKISKVSIREVLAGLRQLESWYCRR